MPYMHNPYDFANPVTNMDVFSGRDAEKEEALYYLKEAFSAPRPINLAVLGDRASGKTSFLNFIQQSSDTLGFICVRIDLDEADSEGAFGFFFKIFDGIVTAVCASDAYGGLSGKTYDTYLDIVNTFVVPEDKIFCPFLFPIRYAKAMSVGHGSTAQVPDNSLKLDLQNIARTLSKPILVIFDECDVLYKSRVLLEKMRNIFMNIPGYMLGFVGQTHYFHLLTMFFRLSRDNSRRYLFTSFNIYRTLKIALDCRFKLAALNLTSFSTFREGTYSTIFAN